MTELRPDAQKAVDFLTRLYQRGPWHLFSVFPDRSQPTTNSFTQNDIGSGMMRLFIEKQNELGKNIYYHANQPAPGEVLVKNAEKSQIRSAHYVWVDVDPAGGNIDQEKKRIVESLTTKRPNGIPEPTFIVFSGGGFQALWRLAEPVQLDGTPEAFAAYEAYNRELERVFGADHCHNANRVLRVAYTVNWPDAGKLKKGRTAQLAKVVHTSANSYPLSAFTAAAPKKELVEKDLQGLQARQLRDVAELDKYGIPSRVAWLIANGHPGLDPAGWRECGHHQSDEKNPNDRSRWVLDVCANLLRCEVPPELVLGIITDERWPISSHVRDPEKNGGKMVRYAERQIRRSLGFAEHDDDKPDDPVLVDMNRRFALVSVNGKARIISWEDSDVDPSRKKLELTGPRDFQLLHQHPMVQVGEDKNGNPSWVPRGKWWLGHPQRRQYDGIRFEPGQPQKDRYLNLWQGWGIEPKTGDWSLMRDHIRKVLASGNEEYDAYILKWMAWAVQNPGKPAEVALVFRGGRGTGKSLTARCLLEMFGQHGMAVANPKLITGNFNAHLQDCCFLFGDEAFSVNDKKAESALKMLITEPTIPIERKGVDCQQARNCIHLMMASNDSWVVPAGIDERRFAVFKVSDEFKQRREYFAPIFTWLERGGASAMLRDLLDLDLGGWHPRNDIPQTEELARQKDRSLRGVEKLIHEMLKSGRAIGALEMNSEGEVFVATDIVIEHNKLTEKDRHAVVKFLSRCIEDPTSGSPRKRKDGRQYRGHWLPPLDRARRLWNERSGVPFPWPGDVYDWDTGLDVDGDSSEVPF